MADDDPTIIDVTPDPTEADNKTAKPAAAGATGWGRRLLLIVALVGLGAVFAAGVAVSPWLADRWQRLAGLPAAPGAGNSGGPVDVAGDGVGETDAALLWAQIEQLREQVQRGAQPARTAAQIEDLEARLRDLESRPDQVAETGAPARGLAEISDRLETLEARLATAESKLSALSAGEAGAAADKIRALEASLSSVQQNLEVHRRDLDALSAGEVSRLGASYAMLALARLRQSVENGQTYSAAYSAAERLVRDQTTLSPPVREALATLEANADTGVASLATLQAEFAALAPDLAAAARIPADAPWWRRFIARMTSGVTLRRTGDLDGDSPEATVARAEARLTEGELAGALDQLAPLASPAPALLQPWLEKARTRLAVMAALGRLESLLSGHNSDTQDQ